MSSFFLWGQGENIMADLWNGFHKLMKSGRITKVVKLLRDQEKEQAALLKKKAKLKEGKTYGYEKVKRRNRTR